MLFFLQKFRTETVPAGFCLIDCQAKMDWNEVRNTYRANKQHTIPGGAGVTDAAIMSLDTPYCLKNYFGLNIRVYWYPMPQWALFNLKQNKPAANEQWESVYFVLVLEVAPLFNSHITCASSRAFSFTFRKAIFHFLVYNHYF